MKRFSIISIMILTVCLLAGMGAVASAQELPVIGGKRVVAVVNDEPITLEQFNLEKEGKEKEGKKDSESLSRLINRRLIVQEARKTGFSESQEVKKKVDLFSRVALEEELMAHHVKGIKADEKEVDKLYKEFVKEWKINSVTFEKEEAAKKVEEEVKAGGDFAEITKKLIAEGAAKGGEQKNYLKPKDLHPQIVEAIFKMKNGSVTSIIPLRKGFVILQLHDVRFLEIPEIREVAREEVLIRKKGEAWKRYEEALIEKYAKVDKKVLENIDYEAKEPGFQELLKDKRVIVEMEGENPITVGELTEYLERQFPHGVEIAIEDKKLNKKKVPTLKEMLRQMAFRKEAFRLGLDRTEVYRDKIKDYENFLIFEAFLQKSLVPEDKLKEEDLRAYYDAHIEFYTLPEMMKISSLVFGKREVAEEAIEKLRKGTEFKWLMTHVEGQVDKNTKGIFAFEDRFLTTKDLPEGVRKAISGAKRGDFRLFASPEGHFYVLFIREVVPSKSQPFEEARKSIAHKVFNEKLKKTLEDRTEKLRSLSDVKIYLK